MHRKERDVVYWKVVDHVTMTVECPKGLKVETIVTLDLCNLHIPGVRSE